MRPGFFATFAMVFSWLAGGIGPAAADSPLSLLYQDRPPYYVTNPDGSVGGLVSGPVATALRKAEIPFEWKVRPGKRQIETIRKNRAAVCSPGWFKKPKREEFAKFSDPIYRDRPQVVVVRAAERDALPHQTLESLFTDKEWALGAKLGYSYGTFIDNMIAEIKPRMLRTPQDKTGMVRMLLGKRFDYMFAAPEEFVDR